MHKRTHVQLLVNVHMAHTCTCIMDNILLTQNATGWTLTPSHITVVPCSAPVGPRVPTSRDPLEMFQHFFDDEIISLIVRETNLFAAQSLAAANRNTTWETDAAEIKAYSAAQRQLNKRTRATRVFTGDAHLQTGHVLNVYSAAQYKRLHLYT